MTITLRTPAGGWGHALRSGAGTAGNGLRGVTLAAQRTATQAAQRTLTLAAPRQGRPERLRERPEDSRAARAARRAERAAAAQRFAAFHAASADRLASELFLVTGEVATARRCTQEAFARAWLYWHQLDRGADDPFAWVHSVGYRLAESRVRRSLSAFTQTPPLEGEVPAGLVAAHAVVSRLPRTQRAALVLHHHAGLPVESVATTLQLTVRQAASRIDRGTAVLAPLLAGQRDEMERLPLRAPSVEATRKRAAGIRGRRRVLTLAGVGVVAASVLTLGVVVGVGAAQGSAAAAGAPVAASASGAQPTGPLVAASPGADMVSRVGVRLPVSADPALLTLHDLGMPGGWRLGTSGAAPVGDPASQISLPACPAGGLETILVQASVITEFKGAPTGGATLRVHELAARLGQNAAGRIRTRLAQLGTCPLPERSAATPVVVDSQPGRLVVAYTKDGAGTTSLLGWQLSGATVIQLEVAVDAANRSAAAPSSVGWFSDLLATAARRASAS